MQSCSAQIIARSEQDDLAVLQVSNPPASMVPLIIAEQSPEVGDKVYALGNPGLGNDTLDLSLSEGIVSSTDRTIDDDKYLQDTAAVNPGNSGGPLLNETGSIVGLVCLKSDLEGVSFATPAQTIRDFYNQNSAASDK
jgi:S1-C subfamily serine protease